jgi:hypothetical protein
MTDELSLCQTCNCMTKKVCGKCKREDIEKAVRKDITDMLYAHKVIHDGYIKKHNETIDTIINLINNK